MTTSLVAIVDYGVGNLGSVEKAARRAGLEVQVTDDPAAVIAAPGIILPGVGALRQGRERLEALGLDEALARAVAAGRPFLGICLGLQLLFGAGEEGGSGLGLLPGRIPRLTGVTKIPEIGWNLVEPIRESPLFRGLEDGGYFYFVHSYYVAPEEPGDVLAEAEYGVRFAAAVQRGALFGVQFHPEKSGPLGLKLLRNFGEVVAGAAKTGH